MPTDKTHYQPYWIAYCDAHGLAYDHQPCTHCEYVRWIGEQHRAFMPNAHGWMRTMPKYVGDFLKFLNAKPTYADCAAIAGNPGECCARWCDDCKVWIGDGHAVIVTPPGSVASDDNQYPTCPFCGGKIERIMK